MKVFKAVLILCLFNTSLIASDYDPPKWRGESGSSLQIWRFDFLNDEAMSHYACHSLTRNTTPWGEANVPDVNENPFQESTGICSEYKTPWMISGRMDWLQQHDLRTGVWMLQGDRRIPVFMNFMVPNADVQSGTTEIHIQLIFQSLHAAPEIILRLPADDPDQPFHEVRSKINEDATVLPFNWMLGVYRFQLDHCPLYQVIRLIPPENREQIYIDEIGIDTLCKKRQ